MGIGICKPKLIDTRSATLSTDGGTWVPKSRLIHLLFPPLSFRAAASPRLLFPVTELFSSLLSFSLHYSVSFSILLGFDPRKLSVNIRERKKTIARFLADMPQINPSGSHPHNRTCQSFLCSSAPPKKMVIVWEEIRIFFPFLQEIFSTKKRRAGALRMDLLVVSTPRHTCALD